MFFIDDVVDGMALTALEARYAVRGEHAYDPRLLLKVWLYGATQGGVQRARAGAAGATGLGVSLSRRGRRGAGLSDDESVSGHREDVAAVLRETVRLAVWAEWNLVAAACNLRRLFALGVVLA